MTPQFETQFAPAERASHDSIVRQARLLADIEMLRPLYDAVTEAVVILNSQRQIIFCNCRLPAMLGIADPSQLEGLRPGEALNCVHSSETHGGCGTTEFCSACGAVNAILVSQSNLSDVRECNILRQNGDALDLRVAAHPLELHGERLTVCSISDVSHERRRRSLERVFFHDLMNTVAGVQMLADLLPRVAPERQADIRERLQKGVDRLREEITEQRDLMSAESSELSVQWAPISAGAFLADLAEWYRRIPLGSQIELRLEDASEGLRFHSDPVLLGRVLGNMIKNALEATPRGGQVTAGCRRSDGGVEFWVHNASAMPRDVQLQVFQRSFSTKGPGRGLGTYSMRLLTHRFLKGRVSFSSSEAGGTTFRAWCPLDRPS